MARYAGLPSIVRVALVIGAAIAAWPLVSTTIATFRAAQLAALADSHRSWGRMESARDAIEQAVAATPGDAARHVDLAQINVSLFSHRGLEDAARRAEEALLEAIDLNPLNAETLGELGWLYVQRGHLEEASEAFERALEIDPNNTYYLASLGLLRERQGRQDDAANLYQNALEVMPNAEIAGHLQRLGLEE